MNNGTKGTTALLPGSRPGRLVGISHQHPTFINAVTRLSRNVQREREKRKLGGGRIERHYFGGELKNYIFGLKGLQAVPDRPTGRANAYY
jgi:hypothetical protein